MPCRCPHGPREFSSSWISPKTSRTILQTNPGQRRSHCMLAHRHHNWNHQHWSLALFADESIVSLYKCNRHARVSRRVVERLVDCCIQETDGIRRHDDQSGRDRSWTHHRMSDESSADGPSLGACLPTCVSGINDVESVWGISLDVVYYIQPLLNRLGPCRQWQGIQLNRCPLSPWVRLLLSGTHRRTLDGNLWHSSSYWHLPLGNP